MLLRWATKSDIPAWEALSGEYDPHISAIAVNYQKWYHGFQDYMMRKIEQYEAVLAADRMSGTCNGAIAFSRAHNRITFFAVSPKANRLEASGRLLTVALRQLDSNRAITVNLPAGDFGILAEDLRFFGENGFEHTGELAVDGCPMSELTRKADGDKRGGSFHYRYPEFIKASQRENCPVCNDEPAPLGQDDIEVNDTVWVCGEYPGQGRLFGKLYVMPRKHFFHFEYMPDSDAAAFMCEVRRVGRALRRVTGAEKINYEMHANSGAHLHIHLFPRYLDDEFPSAPIDYRISEPAPYESYDEYLWFVSRMREELARDGE